MKQLRDLTKEFRSKEWKTSETGCTRCGYVWPGLNYVPDEIDIVQNYCVCDITYLFLNF